MFPTPLESNAFHTQMQKSFDNSLGVIKNMGEVVDSLFRRAKQL